MKWIAALFWACFAWAGYAYLSGDDGALTAIAGAGIVAVTCTVLWWIESAA